MKTLTPQENKEFDKLLNDFTTIGFIEYKENIKSFVAEIKHNAVEKREKEIGSTVRKIIAENVFTGVEKRIKSLLDFADHLNPNKND